MIMIIMILNLMIIFHEIIVHAITLLDTYGVEKYMRANKKAVTTPPCGGRKGVCHCAPFPILKKILENNNYYYLLLACKQHYFM